MRVPRAINRFRIGDGPLDSPTANGAAAIVALTGLSVADAHTGALAQSLTGGDVVVLTSDPRDMVRAASPVAIRAVRI